MTPLALAWRTARRYRARAVLAIIGVTVIGALNFDMLMLSRGLMLSFAGLLNSTDYNIRISGSAGLPLARSPIDGASSLMTQLAALPEIASVGVVRTAFATMVEPNRPPQGIELIGSSQPSGLGIWRRASGSSLNMEIPARAPQTAVISRAFADRFHAAPGSTIHVRVAISGSMSAVPAIPLRVVGVGDFPFEPDDSPVVATTLAGFAQAHGGVLNDQAEFMFAASRPGVSTDSAVAAIEKLRSDIRALSNDQLVANFGSNAFTYFRQISIVLSSTTAAFSLLLVTTLLTVSVNQRLGEVAALRALGVARRRIAATLLWEAVLLVGIGGAAALPLGQLLARLLDSILRKMPGLPSGLHFFVFEPQSIVLHAAVLSTTAIVASAYPVWLAVRLPIAQTLRQEVVS
ncbi:MAG TPA: FtsX-like permease family protein [Vicinamibacterales bacterium]|nr:FtsX-like permease family protein [Vicinamibacterales bacterium]